MIEKLLGESAQAAALREMKAIDPSFRLSELVELMEHVIAPHLVHSFLNGNREALKHVRNNIQFILMEFSFSFKELTGIFAAAMW